MPVTTLLPVRRAAVDVEFHALDILPLRAVVVHVEIAEVQLAQLPFERAGFHAEVDECADCHVATDAGNAVEVEGFHKRRVVRFCADANCEVGQWRNLEATKPGKETNPQE